MFFFLNFKFRSVLFLIRFLNLLFLLLLKDFFVIIEIYPNSIIFFLIPDLAI